LALRQDSGMIDPVALLQKASDLKNPYSSGSKRRPYFLTTQADWLSFLAEDLRADGYTVTGDTYIGG
jgi:hypothetical protein